MISQVEQLHSFSDYLDKSDNVAVNDSFDYVEKPKLPEIPTGEVVAQLLVVTFGLIASKKGEHWNLDTAEAKAAGDAYGDVIDKYFPDSIGSMGVEITAIMVTGMLITPRIMEDAKKLPAAANDEGKRAADAGTSTADFQGIKKREGE